MNKINDFIVKNRIIRRILVFVLTYYFIRISIDFFSGTITAQSAAAYGIFAGLEREILRFFLQGTRDEADSD